ncbi:Hypothetical predicted protein [Podarcis lilfordi]|uniref:Uncharacterized protein n=1 Tax=Podarcis lilfordi TaxID=74358 RepID=A0AA35PUZ9_9SAUR|nr:Hypothetical predicted protein [Podarcis lilfordi]
MFVWLFFLKKRTQADSNLTVLALEISPDAVVVVAVHLLSFSVLAQDFCGVPRKQMPMDGRLVWLLFFVIFHHSVAHAKKNPNPASSPEFLQVRSKTILFQLPLGYFSDSNF